jgi:hypothetical protein
MGWKVVISRTDSNSDEARARAEAKFQKQQQADQQAAAAKAEREAQAQAVDANTARLKPLRLAKETAGKEAAQAKAAAPKTKWSP